MIAENPQNREERLSNKSVRNGRSTKQLSIAHPLNSLCPTPNRYSVPSVKLKIVILLGAAEHQHAVVRKNAETVAIAVLACSVSKVGSGHSDHEIPVSSIDNFNFVAVPSYERLTGENRLLLTHTRFDSGNSVGDCRVAVG